MATYRMAVEGSLGGSLAVNVQHFTFLAGVDTGLQLLQDWQQFVKSLYLASLPAGYSMTRLVAVDVASLIRSELASTGTGGRTGELGTRFAAPLVSWTTGIASRRARGRTYLPGVVESDILGDQIATVLSTAIASYVQGHFAPATFAANWRLIIRSEIPPPTNFTVTQGIVRATVGVQRRRKLGVGA